MSRYPKTFEKRPGSDGQDCRVVEIRLPARFYRVEALAGVNSVGTELRPFALGTGSGSECEKLALACAAAIADGVLALD